MNNVCLSGVKYFLKLYFYEANVSAVYSPFDGLKDVALAKTFVGTVVPRARAHSRQTIFPPNFLKIPKKNDFIFLRPLFRTRDHLMMFVRAARGKMFALKTFLRRSQDAVGGNKIV